jgi:acylphosphatase
MSLVAVYSPPAASFPYLGAVIHSDGTVQAMAFGTESEAQSFVDEIAAELEKLVEKEKKKGSH